MSEKRGDNRERRARIKQAKEKGLSASESATAPVLPDSCARPDAATITVNAWRPCSNGKERAKGQSGPVAEPRPGSV